MNIDIKLEYAYDVIIYFGALIKQNTETLLLKAANVNLLPVSICVFLVNTITLQIKYDTYLESQLAHN